MTNVDKLDALYVLFDAYCAEVGLSTYNDETELHYSADEIMHDLPENSPHKPFIRTFINLIEEMQQ